MKVLHIEDWFHPEMGYQVNFFSKYHSTDIETYILATDSFELWKKTDSEEIINVKDKEFEKRYGVKIIRSANSLNGKNKYGTWIKNLKTIIREVNPDIIYTHGVETFNSMRIIFSSLSKKYKIVSDTHTLLNQFKSGWKFKLYMLFFKLLYVPTINRKNITVFYTAEENRRILQDIYKINPANIKSCLIGTDFSQYKYDESCRRELSEKLQIPQNEKVILYTGKFSDTKQPHLILQAIKLIESKITETIHLVFVGAQEKEYMEKYFNYNFAQNIKVQLLPAVPANELYKYYSFADFAVFPKENTLSALDSQACKLPVIMQNDLTNAERLQKGGLVYESDNLNDLGDKILKLLSDNHLRKKLGEEGFIYVTENYDYKRIIEKMENELKNIINNKQ